MNIGDYISCGYTAPTTGVAGTFTAEFLNNAISAPELSTTPPPNTNSSSNGYYFYLIKVDTGLLIADRLVQSNISAQALNIKNYLTGAKLSDKCMIRCLSKEEFSKYITNSDLNGNITKQDVNVWHGKTGTSANTIIGTNPYPEINQNRNGSTICTSLFMNGSVLSNTYHVLVNLDSRNMFTYNLPIYISYTITSYTTNEGPITYFSFRPALEYIDNIKSTNIYY
jgi:hypothetical protein